jgi:hypothetical protein
MMNRISIFPTITAVIFASLAVPARAVQVSIPDPGLNTAIRQALQKPTGPLTDQDLLSLTDLTLRSQSITNLQGLEAAHNLRPYCLLVARKRILLFR